jgi:hypothetical protein
MYITEKTKEIDYFKLQEELERQYGPATAQDIVDRLKKTEKAGKEPDYMDVKLLSELAEKFRAQAMMWSIWKAHFYSVNAKTQSRSIEKPTKVTSPCTVKRWQFLHTALPQSGEIALVKLRHKKD